MENKKINIAELLKDCPKGMELDCTMFENLYFEEITNAYTYPISCYSKRNGIETPHHFTKEGCYHTDANAKCVIFPKGKTTWEGFVPPCEFKDGDIVAKDTYNGTQLFIFKEDIGNGYAYCYMMLDDDGKAYFVFRDFRVQRLATEEEKKKLFDAIKSNGYRWNAETKTLEKLIVPKFKVGDKIISIVNEDCEAPAEKGVISKITDDMYVFTDGSFIFFSSQDEWELVHNKFDINTLVPFEDKVLVRDEETDKWMPATWGFYDDSLEFNYTVEGGNGFNMCIPYKGNEHLLGTQDDCSEYFKTWED